MLSKWITPLLLLVAGYWFWTGPYQEMQSQSYEDSLRRNAENMQRCIDAEGLAGSLNGRSERPKDVCARKYKLYFEDGYWHSYEVERPEDWRA